MILPNSSFEKNNHFNDVSYRNIRGFLGAWITEGELLRFSPSTADNARKLPCPALPTFKQIPLESLALSLGIVYYLFNTGESSHELSLLTFLTNVRFGGLFLPL